MRRMLRPTDASFESEVERSDIPVLVEFWGSWCLPCQMMEPTLSALAAEYAGRLKVAKINADQNPRTVARYTVQGLPTFIVFDAGEVKARRMGAQSLGQLQMLLEETQVLPLLSEAAHPIASGSDLVDDQQDDGQIL